MQVGENAGFYNIGRRRVSWNVSFSRFELRSEISMPDLECRELRGIGNVGKICE